MICIGFCNLSKSLSIITIINLLLEWSQNQLPGSLVYSKDGYRASPHQVKSGEAAWERNGVGMKVLEMAWHICKDAKMFPFSTLTIP